MKALIGILICIPFLLWGGVRIYKGINYNIECSGHLKRAADANTIDLAKKEMETALKYIESQNMTTGYTSVLYRTPDEDVSFWYQNLAASFTELKTVLDKATQLEKSNLLMKLRETLLDQGENSQNVTAPDGISIFPNNTEYAVWGWISFVLSIIGGILIMEY